MKNILLFLVFHLAASLSMSGQETENKIDWGPQYDNQGTYEILGSSAGYTFVKHLGLPTLSNHPNFQILKFDHYQRLENSYLLKEIIGKKRKLIDIYTDKDLIYALVLNEEDKNIKSIEKLAILPSYMKVVKHEKLYAFDGKFDLFAEGYIKKKLFESKKSISPIKSQEGNKLALLIKNEEKRITNTKLVVLDRKDYYEELNLLEITIDDKTENIVDHQITPDGSINVLKKHYFRSKRKEKRDNKPDYHFDLISKPLNGEKATLKIKDENLFLNNFKITNDKQGNIFLAALYERKYGKGAEGTALYKISPDLKLILETKHRSTLLKKKKDQLNKNLEITDFFRLGDHNLVMCREQYSKIENYDTGDNDIMSHPVYYRDKTVIEAFNDLGEFQWSRSIHQKTNQEEDDECSTYNLNFSDEQITIFANMHKANIKDLNHEDPRSRRMPNNDNIITKITLDLDGKMKFDPLTEPWEIFIGKGSTKTIGNQIYVLGFLERYDHVRLGTIPLN